MKTKINKINRKLHHFTVDEDLVLDCGEHWIVVFTGVPGAYLAAWVDEDGEVRTASRKSLAAAVKLASSSWGR